MCKKDNFVCPALPEGFTVTFHAGFMNEKENSVSSVKKAVEMNAPVIELDVTFRDDGTPVTAHLDSAGKDKGELLEDSLAVAALHPSCKLNLDIKSVANIPAVDALVKKHGLAGRTFYTGIEAGWAEEIRKGSNIPYMLNHNVSEAEANDPDFPEFLAGEIKRLGAFALNSNFKYVEKSLVDYLHSEGIPVSLWTANKDDEIKKCLAMAPDNITSRRPDLLEKLMK